MVPYLDSISRSGITPTKFLGVLAKPPPRCLPNTHLVWVLGIFILIIRIVSNMLDRDRKGGGKMKESRYLYLIFASLGFIFLRSSYGKFSGGTFVSTLGDTLTKLASKNPYPWYKDFLLNTAIPNSNMFGVLTMWGELFSGITLVCLSLYLLVQKKSTKLIYMLLCGGFIVGAFLNLIFWLAAGYTSPSTESLNLVMFLVQVIGVFYTLQRLSAIKQ